MGSRKTPVGTRAKTLQDRCLTRGKEPKGMSHQPDGWGWGILHRAKEYLSVCVDHSPVVTISGSSVAFKAGIALGVAKRARKRARVYLFLAVYNHV